MVLLSGCTSHTGSSALERIQQRGTLVVLTRNAPTTYYIGRDGQPTGPEYDMVRAYAHSIGVKPKFVIKRSVAGLLHALAEGKGDLVAAGITVTPPRKKQFDFGPPYQQIRQQVVCRRDGTIPADVDDLAKVDLEVIADSSYVTRLKALRKTHPDLHWRTNASVGTEQLLRKVWKAQLDCTIADSDIVAINRRFFPNLKVAFDLTRSQSLAWVLPHGSDKLRHSLDDWLQDYREQGALKRLMAHYYAHVKVFDYVDTRTYVRRIESRYPEYQSLFEKAGDTWDVSPILLAAQAYQESHWDPHATSPTGVRGMMMLTRNTAASLGVDNRLNPAASIKGGAEYLAHMRQSLKDPDALEGRIWFALAAYNIGLAHLRDARELTRQLGKDPDRWSDVATVLPLLSERRYYSKLPHGYARGLEPVRYVTRIRNYADILRHYTQQAQMQTQASAAPVAR